MKILRLASMLLACAALIGAAGCSDDTDTDGVGGAGGSGGAGGDSCAGAVCGPQQVCIKNDGDCGMTDPTDLVCKDVPLDCNYPEWLWEPTCGCNGVVYPTGCRTLSKTALSNCDKIECGDTTCDKASQYCEIPSGGSGSCKDLPGACGATPDCTCLAAEACGPQCQGSVDGGFKLACDAP